LPTQPPDGRGLSALTWSSDGSAALWDARGHEEDRDAEEEDEEDGGPVAFAPLAVAAVSSDSATEPFPLLRCAVSGDGRQLLAGGGCGGARGFLGTPVWLYDLVLPQQRQTLEGAAQH
jgi:hypothetical protein